MLTDDQGNAIPADDPRLPTAQDLQDLQATVGKLQSAIEAHGGQIGPLVEIQAKVDTLVSLFVPNDEDAPIRRLFDIRVQEAKRETLAMIAQEIQEAQAPRLIVPTGPQSVPLDPNLLRGPG